MLKPLYSFMALTIALSVGLVVALFYPQSASLVLWTFALLSVSPLLVAFGKRSWRWLSRQDLFSPLIAFPLTYLGWFTIGSIDFVRLPSSVSFGAFDPIPPRVWLYCGIGLVGYLCGARSSMSYSKKLELDRASAFRFTWERKTFRFALLITLLVAVGTYLFVVLQTGIVALRRDAGEFVYELEGFHRAMTPFFMASYTSSLFLAAFVFIDAARGGAKARSGPIFVISIIVLCLVGLGGRSFFFPPVLTAVILHHYVRRPLRLKTAVAVVLILFMFLSAFGYVRALTVGGSFNEELAEAGVPPAALPLLYCYFYFRFTVATFRDVSEIIPSQVFYQHGAITFTPFLSLLPGHHHMSDYFFKDLLGNDFPGAGLPATVLGPFYADFGPVGIFGGMFAWGLLVTKLYRWMLRDGTAFSALIYAWTTQAGLFGLYGGMFAYLGTLVIPLGWLLLNILLERRAGRSDVAGFSSLDGATSFS